MEQPSQQHVDHVVLPLGSPFTARAEAFRCRKCRLIDPWIKDGLCRDCREDD